MRGAISTAGYTQAQVATEASIALNTFSRRINGALPFTWPELVRVAVVLDIPASELATTAERLTGRGRTLAVVGDGRTE